MAEHVKFRWTTAKVGASMALLALVATAAEKARSTVDHVTATPAASVNFLKLGGLSKAVSGDFLKVEKKLLKLDGTVSKIQSKFLKLEGNLTKNYYKIDQANKVWLKIKDASSEYLKIDGTAANAQKVGGLAPSSFFQGNGNVVSGALSSISGNSPQQLLSLPGGIIVVSVTAPPAGAAPTLTIFNGTGAALVAVGDINGKTNAITLNPGGNPVMLPAVQTPTEASFQIFPGGTFTKVVSILIGLTPNPTTGNTEAVAQAFTGGV